MTSPTNPHDAVFHLVFGDPAHAASSLQAVLPEDLVSRLEFDRLARVPGSFVDSRLRSRYSDLLFSVPLGGRDAFVYVLVEHQSSSDRLMPFRMLQYVVRIWDDYLRSNPGVRWLPAVIPLVVHHDRRPWVHSTDLADLIDLDGAASEAVREYVPQFRFLLDDLAAVDVAALRARPVSAPVRLTLLLLKVAAGNSQISRLLIEASSDASSILAGPGGRELMAGLVTYISTVGETPADELYRVFADLGPAAEEVYVTTAEMLRAEGEARGEARGRAEALLQLLTLRFGAVPEPVFTRVHAASAKDLETWTARVLSADRLDDVVR